MKIDIPLQLPALRLSFAAKIFLLFFFLLMAIQSMSSWIVYRAATNEAKQQVTRQLDVASRLFTQEFANREAYLKSSVEIVARDWAFRQAVGENDAATIKDVLDNFGGRIQSDIAIYYDMENDVFATTLDISNHYQQNIYQALTEEKSSYLIAIENQIYLTFVATVNTPMPSGWLIIGFKIDNALAEYFKSITGLEMNFVQRLPNENRVVATTLGEELLLLNELDLPALTNYKANKGEYPLQDDIMRVIIEIGELHNSTLFVVQQESTSKLLASYKKWWWDILILFVVSLVFLGGIAYLLSNSITEPLRQLLAAITKIATGDYQHAVDVKREDEIGELAKEFQVMQAAIKVREQEILYRAEHSLLTGLHNREKFIDIINRTIVEEQPSYLGVIVLNIKRFKDVNDTLGHHLGDKMLANIGQRLEENYAFDHLGHLGADQFGIFCMSDALTTLNQFAETILDIFTQPFHLEGLDLSLSINIGVSVFPQHTDTGQSLVRLAEVAMFQAKNQHTDISIYDASKDQHSVQHLTLMGELPEAIKNENLVLHYQPVLDLTQDNPTVAKVECLVRWIHPSLGFIPPDEFISLAEQTGSITDLTHWVLNTAIKQMAKGYQKGQRIRFAVNLSAVDLLKGRLETVVPQLLNQYGIPSELLVLEITESTVVQDPEAAIQTLQKLRDLGIKLSIDDYGTGYSSLSQLKNLPVDELKIDKSFVLDLPYDNDDSVIVRSTISLGHTMGLKIVAEGVENQATLAFLAEAGCDYAQGFYVSKPLPAEQFEVWLAETEYPIANNHASLV